MPPIEVDMSVIPSTVFARPMYSPRSAAGAVRVPFGDRRNPESGYVPGKSLYSLLLSPGKYELAAYEDGLLFLQRKGSPGDERPGMLAAAAAVESASPATPAGFDFGNRLRLLGYELDGSPTALELGRRHRITYFWQVLDGFDDPFVFRYGTNPIDDVQRLTEDYVLIDTFTQAGRDPVRVVHLPTYLLLPPREWRPGQIIREDYEFSLPADLGEGTIVWQAGLYVAPRFFPIRATLDRLVPGTAAYRMPDLQAVRAP